MPPDSLFILFFLIAGAILLFAPQVVIEYEEMKHRVSGYIPAPGTRERSRVLLRILGAVFLVFAAILMCIAYRR